MRDRVWGCCFGIFDLAGGNGPSEYVGKVACRWHTRCTHVALGYKGSKWGSNLGYRLRDAFSYFPFGSECRMWVLIVSVPDHCLSFYIVWVIKFGDAASESSTLWDATGPVSM